MLMKKTISLILIFMALFLTACFSGNKISGNLMIINTMVKGG